MRLGLKLEKYVAGNKRGREEVEMTESRSCETWAPECELELGASGVTEQGQHCHGYNNPSLAKVPALF